MPQFFIKSSDIINNKCVLRGDDFHHLFHVRRVKIGDKIKLRSEDGAAIYAKINDINKSESVITAEIITVEPFHALPIQLNLCAAILKGKKFDLVLQKAVEIGVSRITPVVTERSIPEIDAKEKKIARWKKIIAETSKQCMAQAITEIDDIQTFKELVLDTKSGIRILAHSETNGKSMKEFLKETEREENVSLLVGPEGGFSLKEVELAKKYGWQTVNFGFTTMKAETAALVLPSILIYEWS